MELATKLRYHAWEIRKRLSYYGGKFASNWGEHGEDLVNTFMEGLEAIESLTGIVENKLLVPGGVIDQGFVQQVDNILKSLDAVFDGPKERKKEAENVAENFSQLANWGGSGRPLVIEKEGIVNENDRANIIKMIIDSNDDDQLSVIHVIGMPGTGKTTLSQYIYHSKQVYGHFDVRHWVGMSENQKAPTKLLDLVFRQKSRDIDVRTKFHEVVDGKRYLLILDDSIQAGLGVFLHELLGNVSRGSKIVLTTTKGSELGSLEPLRVGKSSRYELGHFTEEECWASFESIAFSNGDNEGENEALLAIGWDICNKYANIPRLVKNIAALLSSKHSLEEWENVRDTVVKCLHDPLESILVKINLWRYKELSSELKQCLAYCSLFPKGYVFDKDQVIHLWGADENLLTRETKAKELVGDEYFRELQNNGFFLKESKIDHDDGSITISYKIDCIVHDFLKDVRNHEFHSMHTDQPLLNFEQQIKHLSFVFHNSWNEPLGSFLSSQVNSLFYLPAKHVEIANVPDIAKTLSSLRRLRALDLVASNCGNLGDSLEGLKELRYLRLGPSPASLPESITKLVNLCSLDLHNSNVIQLPTSFNKLSSLRHLYTGDRLIDLPPSFGSLTSLQTLDVFIVGDNNGLEALNQLRSLEGKLKIRFLKNKEYKNGLENLKYMHLTELSLIWAYSYEGESEEIPKDRFWGPQNIFSPELDGFFTYSIVSLCVRHCYFSQLPAMSSLPRLKSLQLWDLKALECVESGSSGDENPSSSSTTNNFFPSLQHLMLANLSTLKEWSPHDIHQHLIFTRLVQLRLFSCPKMMWMPHVPKLESLEAHNIHGKFLKHILSESFTLKTLTIVSIEDLDCLSINLPVLESLTIRQCPQLENLRVEPLTTLKLLEIHECSKLHLSGALKHLSTLEKLSIVKYNWLNLKNETHEISEEPWQCLQNLQSLKLNNISNLDSFPSLISSLQNLEALSSHSLYNVKELPEWIGNFTKLQRLTIHNLPLLTTLPESLGQLSVLQLLELRNCPKLKQFPDSLRNLKKLQVLDVRGSNKLVKRCKDEEGKDILKHLPSVYM